MAAGLGFKDFVTGEVLTANDVDGYLMQGVWVFASAAARTSAVASPQEGNMSFLKDTNSTEYYDGAAWVAVAGAGGGITQIGTTTTLSGASTTVSFSATGYKNLYALISGINASAHAKLGIQPNSQTTTIDFTGLGGYGSGADPFAASDSYLQTYQQWDDANTVNNAIFTIYDCESTTLNKNFDFTVGYRDNSNRRACEIIGGLIKDTNAITAIKFVLSAGSFSAGEVRIFGVK
jgi:hypothetical protein